MWVVRPRTLETKHSHNRGKRINQKELEWMIGPIPIDDGFGKELTLQYETTIRNEGIWYTDSNGREFQKRKRNHRSTVDVSGLEPIASSFYPVNAAAYIQDENATFSVVVDRSQGVASLIDGSLEFLVRRRLLVDDRRGVGDPLNETTRGMSPYPPYGTAERQGDGAHVSGKHRISYSFGHAEDLSGMQGASLSRRQMDTAFSEPCVFMTTKDSKAKVPMDKKSFSLMKKTLPPNVMLITFAVLPNKNSTFLVRLGHQYAAGEDPELSKPVTVCLFEIIGHELKKVTEKTLSGNRDYHDWVKHRKVWTDEGENEDDEEKSNTNEVPTSPTQEERTIEKDGRYTVELKPMEIRTFEVEVYTKRQESRTRVPIGQTANP